MTTDSWIATTALLVSAISLVLSYVVFRRDNTLRNTQIRTELLTKTVSLKFEYEKLLKEINRALKYANHASADLRNDLETERNHVKEFLALTETHYKDLVDWDRKKFSSESLEKMRHHIESLLMRTKQDKANYHSLNEELRLVTTSLGIDIET